MGKGHPVMADILKEKVRHAHRVHAATHGKEKRG
jgi:hypothetical protein